MNIKSLLLVLLFFIPFFGCQNDDVADVAPIVIEEPRLASYELVQEIPLGNIQLLAQFIPNNPYLNSIKYGVSIYRVVYYTTYKGEEIEASGLLYLPRDMPGPAPLLSIQHGTEFRKSGAPSVSDNFTGYELFASTGYITLLPDYIGYGASEEIFHPYYDQQHSAAAVIDMLKAGKELLEEENVAFNEKLFLAGYSEGGYVTLAAAKEIEQNPEHGLELTAVAAGAGGYDLLHMLEEVNITSTYTYPAYFAFLLNAYNEVNDWEKPLNYFFQEPYASRLPALLDGTQSGGSINDELTTNLEELFEPGFYEGLKSDGEQTLKEALYNNSFYEWSPSTPTRLYHGTADTVVPVENSVETYEKFIENGSNQVELIKITGGTHGSTLIPMIESLFPWFESLKNAGS